MYNVEGNIVTGYGIEVQKIIASHMPEYSHKLILAQPARIFKDLRNGKNYIAYGPVKTEEREKYLYYSLPCRLVFSDTVMMDSSKAKKFLIGSKISLKKILQDKNLIMGHTKGASYGSEIDNILEEFGTHIKKEIITGSKSEMRQMKMIKAQRIDWMIWDPLTFIDFVEKGTLSNKFGIYEIAEKKETFIAANIVAPKNKWGRQMIDKINTILKKVIPTDGFYKNLSTWVPKELEPSFREGYKKYIMEPAKNN